MLTLTVWAGCKKDNDEPACWECKGRDIPPADTIYTNTFCDKRPSEVATWDTVTWINKKGEEVEYLGCVKQ